MMVPYVFSVRNGGVFVPDLTPRWTTFRRFDGADMMIYAPPIRDLKAGWYGWAWDTKLGGDVYGTIDAGEVISEPSDRYVEQLAVRETAALLFISPST